MSDDPVAVTRQRAARLARALQRVGYGALAVATVCLLVALATDLPAVLVSLVVAGLVVASITLLPAIILGYGVAAAEREDRERGVDGGPSGPRS